MAGRPTEYTPEIHKAICADVADGAAFEAACKNQGIDDSTAYRWLKKYAAFRDDYARAQGSKQVIAGRCVLSAIQKGDVNAAFRYLAIVDPTNWAEKQRLELGGADGGPLTVTVIRDHPPGNG
jgi:hypothetical protein